MPCGSRTVLNSNYLQLSFPYPFLLHTPTLHNDLPILVAWSFWHILKLKSFYVQLENVFSALWAMVTKQFSTSMHFNKFPVKKSPVSSNRFYDNAQLSLRREVICSCCWHIILFLSTSFSWVRLRSCIFVCWCEAEVFVCCSCVQRGNHRLGWCGVVS